MEACKDWFTLFLYDPNLRNWKLAITPSWKVAPVIWPKHGLALTPKPKNRLQFWIAIINYKYIRILSIIFSASIFYEYELLENIFVHLLIFWETTILKAWGYLKLYAAHSCSIFCRTYLNTHVSNYKIKWKKRSSFERLCFWYDPSQQTFTCSYLTTKLQEPGVKTIQDVQD